MSSGLNQPVGVIRHTNVAYVKLQKHGKRFELACYRNKVVNYRNGVEKDLDEVLQIDSVFRNASKGMRASKDDLLECFATADAKVVITEILEKGELQVSEQERQVLQDSLFRDIASIVVDKTLNSDTNLPFTLTIIEKAMRDVQFAVNITKSAKSQSLEVIRKLRFVMPIVKAAMLVRVIITPDIRDTILHALSLEHGITIVEESASQLTLSIDPEAFRPLSELVNAIPASHGASECRLDVLRLRAPPCTTGTTPVAPPSAMPPAPGAAPPHSPSRGRGVFLATGESIAKKRDEQRMRELEEAMGMVATEAALGSGDNDDEFRATGHSGKTDKKKKKKQEKKAKAKARDAQLMTLLQDTYCDSDNDNTDADSDADGDILNEEAQLQAAMLASMGIESPGRSRATSSQTKATTNHTNGQQAEDTRDKGGKKKGTRAKRLEKEERKLREQRAEEVCARVEREAKSRDAMSREQSTKALDQGLADVPPPVPGSSFQPGAAGGGLETTLETSGRKSCNTCGGCFDTTSYRQHFKSEWHRTNLKRKLQNLPIIPSEEEHTELAMKGLEYE